MLFLVKPLKKYVITDYIYLGQAHEKFGVWIKVIP